MIDGNSFSGQEIQPGAIVTGIVSGFTEDGDDFLMNFTGGSTVVDSSPVNAERLDLKIGQVVNVLVNEFDGLEIDTEFISKPNGSIILGDRSTITQAPSTIELDPLTGESLTGTPTQTSDRLISPRRRTTISGEIIRMVDNDEFFLQTNNGRVRVDADLPDSQFLDFQPGETVEVAGEFDDGDFDAREITRPNGSQVLPQTSRNDTISGEIIRMVDNDEFLLKTSDGRVRVDADLPDAQFLDLKRGQRVSVVGEKDGRDFDVREITRPNGSQVLPQTSRNDTISGEIVRMVDNDEFLLKTSDGRVRVDADLPDAQFLDLKRGQKVSVVGEKDGKDFDAREITRPNGSQVLPQTSRNDTISGEIVRMVDNDEFLLQTSDGRVRVDADLPDAQFLDLKRGQKVSVVGEKDGKDFDAREITRPNGSQVLPQTSRNDTISGEIVRMVDNDEFLLQTSDGRVRVDADLPDAQFLDLKRGQRVSVVGEKDGRDFDAREITRPNGSQVLP